MSTTYSTWSEALEHEVIEPLADLPRVKRGEVTYDHQAIARRVIGYSPAHHDVPRQYYLDTTQDGYWDAVFDNEREAVAA